MLSTEKILTLSHVSLSCGYCILLYCTTVILLQIVMVSDAGAHRPFNQWVPACSKNKDSYTCTVNWKCLGLYVTTHLNLKPADAKTFYYKILTLKYSRYK